MSLTGSMTFGESHGVAVGCVVDGIPPGLAFVEADVQYLLDRRRPGQNSLTTNRSENDVVEILSGTENGITLGSPIAMIVRNKDMRNKDYEKLSTVPRPGHADYTYQKKYGIRASSGGGRSSARETVGRVCASGIALKYLQMFHDIRIVAFVDSVMEISLPLDVVTELVSAPISPTQVDERSTLTRASDRYRDCDGGSYSLSDGLPIEHSDRASPVIERIVTRCPHAPTAARIAARIADIRSQNDSCGGTVVGVVSNLPAGLGEPVFDKFHAELSKALMSIPAVKGFEIGSGFEGSKSMTGSAHNDRFDAIDADMNASFRSNHAGGVLGGVTTGANVYFRIALKPVSSIGQTQETCDFAGNMQSLTVEGRHDPCVLPRVPQIVESVVAITVMDFVLRNNVFAPIVRK